MDLLKIKNFKCIQDDEIQFRNLTVFAGANGTGKSSVIQILLILKQSEISPFSTDVEEKNKELIVNDYYCELGNAASLLNTNASNDEITFIFNEKNSTEIVCNIDTSQNALVIKHISKEIQNIHNTVDENLVLIHNIEFISADRYGPKSFYYTDRNFGKYKVGKYGEYSALILNKYKHKILNYEVNNTKVSLFSQVNYWLDKIINGLEVDTVFLNEANVAVLKMTTNKPDIGMKSPVNMPYGASYILPIIVGCLVRFIGKDAHLNSMVIIENPEAHLHPAAQSRLGRFLAEMANKGLKIILETHSEHIINGIRIAVKRQLLHHEKVLFNYFDNGENIDDHSIEAIEVQPNGKIHHWPNGFFDQYEKDMMELM